MKQIIRDFLVSKYLLILHLVAYWIVTKTGSGTSQEQITNKQDSLVKTNKQTPTSC